jgi:molybdopterin-synthase adenylyltransferase
VDTSSGELRGVLDATGLELVRLSDGSVLAKRGVREVRVRDAAACALLDRLAPLLDGTRTAGDVLAALPEEERGQAIDVLAFLLERRLAGDAGIPDTAEARFWLSFGGYGVPAPARLRSSCVSVVGAGLIARVLVEQLLACGVGRVEVLPAPPGEDAWLDDLVAASNGAGTVRRAGALTPEASLLCAAADAGESAALMDANRQALEADIPFLPVWAAELVGYVGPLTEPFDTACLRCYQLRLESNSPHPEVVRALREHRAVTPDAGDASGLLPPMATALGAVAAMEAVKRLGGFAPADVIGHVIELNLVSFGSRVRRVLKLPRCPECSDTVRRGPVALTRGPQIPGR